MSTTQNRLVPTGQSASSASASSAHRLPDTTTASNATSSTTGHPPSRQSDSVHTDHQAAADTGPKSKPRSARACSACNRQKLRCDGNLPCSRCVSSGIPERCEYLPSMRGKTRKRKSTGVPPPSGQAPSLAPMPDHGSRAGVTAVEAAPATEASKRARVETQARLDALRNAEDDRAGTLKPAYAMWHKNSALAAHGPRNSAIWQDAPSPDPDIGVSPMSALSGRSQRSDRMADGLTTLPLPGDLHNPLAVLVQASAAAEMERESGDEGVRHEAGARETEAHVEQADYNGEGDDRMGYYAPLASMPKDEAPHILSLINVYEAERLFELYYKHLHRHLPVLDVAHSAPSAVARRNNFLFNAICCVTARTFNVVLWDRLKEFAQYEMDRIPKEKSIDVVQAHLIYATWNLIRPKSFEHDMTWLRIGLAIRTAMDINLHRVVHVPQAREGLPRWILRGIVRTWLMAYVMDCTLSAQLGKNASIRGEGSVTAYVAILRPKDDELLQRDDLLVASLAEWTQILSRAMDAFRSESDMYLMALGAPDLVQVFHNQFRLWLERTEAATRRCVGGQSGDDMGVMLGMFRLYDNYSHLVVQSFALERALESRATVLPVEFAEYQVATVRLLESFGTDLSAPNVTRGCPDFVFTVVTYGTVSLLKSLEPRLAQLDPTPDRDALLSLARSAADMLAQAAVTPDHLPASQSVFLSRLIQMRSKLPRATTTRTHPPSGAEPHLPTQANVRPLDFGDIDFAAFGMSVAADDTMSMWPPVEFPSRGGSPGAAPPVMHQDDQTPDDAGQRSGGCQSTDEPGVTPNLATWVAQQSATYTLPGPALGLGVGSFGGDGGLAFTQDAFWQNILNSSGAPGMV